MLRHWPANLLALANHARFLIAILRSGCLLNPVASTLPIKFLGRRDGLPCGQVLDLTLDTRDCLWAATPAGLVYYDGARTRVYAEGDGLCSHGIRCVEAVEDGRVWVGSDAGIDIFLNGKVKPQTQPWIFGFVECIQHVSGKTWIGTAKGLVLHEDDAFTLLTDVPFAGRTINALVQVEDGALWVAPAGGGLYFYSAGRWQGLAEVDTANVGEIFCLAAGPAQTVFVGGSEGFGQLAAGDAAAEVRFWRAAKSLSFRVRAVHYADGELWIATADQLQLYIRRKRRWQLSSVILKQVLINNFLQDRLGNICMATETHGIAKISVLRKAIQRIETPGNQSVFSIGQGLKGRLVAGGGSASYWIAPDDNNSVRPIPGLQKKQIWDLLQTQAGTIYAAANSGLWCLEANEEPVLIGADNAVLSRPNRCLVIRDDALYVGTTGGCVVISSGLSMGNIKTQDNEPLGYVYTMILDPDQRLWVGTLGKGLWVEEGDCLCPVIGEGLTNTGNTYAIDARDDGTIVVVQNDSIYTIAPDRTIKLLARSEDAIAAWAIRWADDGTLWAGSTSGLTQYSANDGRIQRRVAGFLDLSDWEFLSSRGLFFESKDSLYCGLNSGLVHVDMHALEFIEQEPEAKIFEIKWQNTDAKIVDDVYVVESGRWSLEIRVFCGWFFDKEDVFYRFRLLGFDETWGDRTTRTSVTFNSLPPGYYQLEVQAQSTLTGHGLGPITQIMVIEVVPARRASNWLMAPLKSFRTVRLINRALFRNKRLHERTRELEREIQNRTADLERAKMKLETSNAELTSQAITDPLTGVGNRRHFDEALSTALASSAVNQSLLSLIILDIDHFKMYNDTYGHTMGDDCLIKVAQALKAALYRSTDLLARYGGEEFAIILSGVLTEDAIKLAERLRIAVERLAIPHKSSAVSSVVTISLGITTILNASLGGNPKIAAKLLIDSADEALYEAKEGGRNRYVFNEY